MKVVIGNDHKGTKLKNKVVPYLESNGYTVIDLGATDEVSTDYPQYAFMVTKALLENNADFGILICGTGIGMSIAANKVKGIRCALVHNKKDASLARKHNDANVLALSSSTSFISVKKIITTFLNTQFSNEVRHTNRINMIKEYEKDA